MNIIAIRSKIEVGGAGKLLVAELTELSSRGHSIVLITERCDYCRELEDAGVTIIFSEGLVYGRRRIRTTFRGIQQIKKVLINYPCDVLYGYEVYTTLLAYFVIQLLRKKHIKIVSLVLGNGRELAKKLAPFPLIVMSESHKRELIEKGVKASKMIVNYPTTIDSNYAREFERSSSLFRKEIGVPDDAFLIGSVYCGHKGAENYADLCDECLNAYDNIHYVFVGDSNRFDEYRKYFSSKPYYQRCHFVGIRHDMPNIMNSLDILSHILALDDYETFGMVIVEAMYFGKPVVATHNGAVPEIVKDQINGYLINNNDKAAYFKAVSEIVKNADALEELRNAAFRFAHERFTLAEHVKNLERIFNSI